MKGIRLLMTVALLVAPPIAGAQGRPADSLNRLLVAAQRGDAEAQEMLGYMYAYGPELFPGVQRDIGAAVKWLDRAARNGRPTALYCSLLRQEALRQGELLPPSCTLARPLLLQDDDARGPPTARRP